MAVMDDVRVNLGNAIKHMREALGWSQNKLARIAQIGQQNISRIERGEQMPGVDMLATLAQALGATPNDVLARAGLLDKTQTWVASDLFSIAAELNESERRQLTEYARWRLREQRARYETDKT